MDTPYTCCLCEEPKNGYGNNPAPFEWEDNEFVIDPCRGKGAFYENERVLDPCRGDGAFYNNFPSNVKKDWCEINEGRDFFDYDEKCDTIMTNAPFVPRKLFWDFVVKGSKVAQRRMFWLLNMGCLNVFTPKRLQQLKNNSWYISHLHIVSDKRWYGRYVMVEMGRLQERNIMTYNLETF